MAHSERRRLSPESGIGWPCVGNLPSIINEARRFLSDYAYASWALSHSKLTRDSRDNAGDMDGIVHHMENDVEITWFLNELRASVRFRCQRKDLTVMSQGDAQATPAASASQSDKCNLSSFNHEARAGSQNSNLPGTVLHLTRGY
ncbi:hypothetical protein CIHG_02646 [Coccidioides immitis H538.4]|uniref:Uncharacterized protein n=2 Tax=Coccidioides immitis TaxID=5501 RepID=A0A0J8RJ42_COCIT|nr:hypothetical protein CIRG_02972 [Coccidioides immitis RMSCC 2394]KMU84862.1 hypothetical protein CIHG_02646 [Coccidioides immitis H538.4]